SLVPLLNDVKKQYEAEHAGVSLVLNTAGTQVLKAQIEQGAPADVLISARQKDVDDLQGKGLVESSEHLASNEPILILSTEGARKIKTAADLTQSGVRIVLGDESSPIGEYSRKALQKMGEPSFYEKVLKNVVSNESNEQNVLAKVVLGEADAGMVYQTSFQEEKAKGTAISAITIDKAQNVRSDYYLVRLKGLSSGGGEFAKWMMGDKGKELLQKHGFLL
ncbi:MAG: molybdate ABC transporter substrate-binding protein, partial [Tumebacillaceae bacterium]